jgi:hypothetical protein
MSFKQGASLSDISTPDFDLFLNSIDLSKRLRLRSLHLFVPHLTNSYELIPNFLNRLQSPVIQSILFCIETKPVYLDTWSIFPLKTLARTLAKHLDGLYEVIFELKWDHHSIPPSLVQAEPFFKDEIGYPVADLVKVRMYNRKT